MALILLRTRLAVYRRQIKVRIGEFLYAIGVDLFLIQIDHMMFNGVAHEVDLIREIHLLQDM